MLMIVNGWRMPLSVSGDDYAIKIEEWIKTDKFSDLSASALNLYQTRNSWKAWGGKFQKNCFFICIRGFVAFVIKCLKMAETVLYALYGSKCVNINKKS